MTLRNGSYVEAYVLPKIDETYHTTGDNNDLLAMKLVIQLSKKKQTLLVIEEHEFFKSVDELEMAIKRKGIEAHCYTYPGPIKFKNGSKISFIKPGPIRLRGLTADICWIRE